MDSLPDMHFFVIKDSRWLRFPRFLRVIPLPRYRRVLRVIPLAPSSPLSPEPRADRRIHIRRNRIAIAIGVETHPAAFRLTEIAGTHAREQREVALLFVAIGCLAPC